MRYIDFIDALLIRGQSQKRERAFTLIELLLAAAIVGTLSAIGVPTYNGYIGNARNSSAAVDIQKIESGIIGFQAENGTFPNSLAQVGFANACDPWGRPYQYLRMGPDPNQTPGHRKDKSQNPLNSDFDLYSMGKDGKSEQPLTAKASHDDIVRANNGAFVGLASDY